MVTLTREQARKELREATARAAERGEVLLSGDLSPQARVALKGTQDISEAQELTKEIRQEGGLQRGRGVVTTTERGTKVETTVTSGTGEVISKTVERRGPVFEKKQPTRAQVTGTGTRQTVPLRQRDIESVQEQNLRTIRDIARRADIEDDPGVKAITGTITEEIKPQFGSGFTAPIVRRGREFAEEELEKSFRREKEIKQSLSIPFKQPDVFESPLLTEKQKKVLKKTEEIKFKTSQALGEIQLAKEKATQFVLGGEIRARKRIAEEPLSIAGDIALGAGLTIALPVVAGGLKIATTAIPKLTPVVRTTFKTAELASKAAPALIGGGTVAAIALTPGGAAEKGATAAEITQRFAAFGIGAQLAKPVIPKIQEAQFKIRLKLLEKKRPIPTFEYIGKQTKFVQEGKSVLKISDTGKISKVTRFKQQLTSGEIALGTEGQLDPNLRQLGLDPKKPVQQIKGLPLAKELPQLGTGRIDPSIQESLTSKPGFKDGLIRFESGQPRFKPGVKITIPESQEKLGITLLRRGLGEGSFKGGPLRSKPKTTPKILIGSKKGTLGKLILEDQLSLETPTKFTEFLSKTQIKLKTGLEVPKGQDTFIKGATQLLALSAVSLQEKKQEQELTQILNLRKKGRLAAEDIYGFKIKEAIPSAVLRQFAKKEAIQVGKLKAKQKAKLIGTAVFPPETITETKQVLIPPIQIPEQIPVGGTPFIPPTLPPIETGLPLFPFLLPPGGRITRKRKVGRVKLKKRPTATVFEGVFGKADIQIAQKGVSDISGIILRGL